MEKNVELLDQALIAENLYDDGSHFWFTGFEYNALFKMDKRDGQVELIGVFPNENFIWQRQYISTVRYNETLYFVPFSANEIAEYNMENGIFGKISVDLFDRGAYQTKGRCKFFRAVVVNDKIYFIPFYYPGILCYEPKNGSLTCITDWIEGIESVRVSEWGYFIEYEQVGDRLILPCACADAVVIFDVETQTSRVMRTHHTGYACKFCGISYINDYYYLVSADGMVSKRRLETEDEDTITVAMPQSDSENDFDKIEFYPVRNMGGSIYFFPYQKNDGYKLDTGTNGITRMESFCDEKSFAGGNFSFLTAMLNGGKVYTFTGNSRRFMELDLEHESKKETKLFLAGMDRTVLMNHKKRDFIKRIFREPLMENDFDSLTFALETLCMENEFGEVAKNRKVFGNGNKIYDSLILSL